ncbi:MAG: hypothetical protein LKJ21_10010, partial [Oscillospiraceae bacterium]|nr:hypothetical protein [Oscillospiraceae bacterium]
ITAASINSLQLSKYLHMRVGFCGGAHPILWESATLAVWRSAVRTRYAPPKTGNHKAKTLWSFFYLKVTGHLIKIQGEVKGIFAHANVSLFYADFDSKIRKIQPKEKGEIVE